MKTMFTKGPEKKTQQWNEQFMGFIVRLLKGSQDNFGIYVVHFPN